MLWIYGCRVCWFTPLLSLLCRIRLLDWPPAPSLVLSFAEGYRLSLHEFSALWLCLSLYFFSLLLLLILKQFKRAMIRSFGTGLAPLLFRCGARTILYQGGRPIARFSLVVCVCCWKAEAACMWLCASHCRYSPYFIAFELRLRGALWCLAFFLWSLDVQGHPGLSLLSPGGVIMSLVSGYCGFCAFWFGTCGFDFSLRLPSY